ncbi:hypothetical protein FH608_015960 [Nonomuraea phyllanthi]|uniref:Uncharacterized protein n=1 Tax=Nonomuraea phyllanthi TaxID=2219224 RepID=A0A5C4WK77_9ACTN|nr:hypothetical protein FH608_015960 [Nonomuraea phyllanthi]
MANSPGAPPYKRAAGPPIAVHEVPCPSHTSTDRRPAGIRCRCAPLTAKPPPGSLMSVHRPGRHPYRYRRSSMPVANSPAGPA